METSTQRAVLLCRYFDALLKDNLDYKDIPVRMHRVVVSGAKGLASEASQLQLRILQEDRCQQDTIDLQACQVGSLIFIFLFDLLILA